VLARNWRVREGEIDVIARRDTTIVFCEVKTRRGDGFGLPAEAVTFRKQARLRKLAVRWLADNHARADILRFDVASVTPDGRGAWTVDVLEAAF
jgi:putative endonuclease